MATSPDKILAEAEERMTKAFDYLKSELKGLRTGRASTALVDTIKVEYYGSSTDLKSLAAISIPEPHQILIKPFDAGSIQDIKRGIEASGLGMNPIVESKQIRLNVPQLTRDRRTQLVSQAKKMCEEQKVAMRNARRDANKHADVLAKDTTAHVSEDEIETLKTEIQDLLKKFEKQADDAITKKSAEIMEV